MNDKSFIQEAREKRRNETRQPGIRVGTGLAIMGQEKALQPKQQKSTVKYASDKLFVHTLGKDTNSKYSDCTTTAVGMENEKSKRSTSTHQHYTNGSHIPPNDLDKEVGTRKELPNTGDPPSRRHGYESQMTTNTIVTPTQPYDANDRFSPKGAIDGDSDHKNTGLICSQRKDSEYDPKHYHSREKSAVCFKNTGKDKHNYGNIDIDVNALAESLGGLKLNDNVTEQRKSKTLYGSRDTDKTAPTRPHSATEGTSEPDDVQILRKTEPSAHADDHNATTTIYLSQGVDTLSSPNSRANNIVRDVNTRKLNDKTIDNSARPKAPSTRDNTGMDSERETKEMATTSQNMKSQKGSSRDNCKRCEHEVQLILSRPMIKFDHFLKHRAKELGVALSWSNDNQNEDRVILRISGSITHYSHVETVASEIVSKYHKLMYKPLHIQVTHKHCLGELDIQDDLDSLIRYLTCTVVHKQHGIFVYGFDNNNIDKAVEVLQSVVVEKSIALAGLEVQKADLEEKSKGKMVVYYDKQQSILFVVGLQQYVNKMIAIYSDKRDKDGDGETKNIESPIVKECVQHVTIDKNEVTESDGKETIDVKDEDIRKYLLSKDGVALLKQLQRKYQVEIAIPGLGGSKLVQCSSRDKATSWIFHEMRELRLECNGSSKPHADVVITFTSGKVMKTFDQSSAGRGVLVNISVPGVVSQESTTRLTETFQKMLAKSSEDNYRSMIVLIDTFDSTIFLEWSRILVTEMVTYIITANECPDKMTLITHDRKKQNTVTALIDDIANNYESALEGNVVAGTLDKIKADVIVNTTSTKLDLNQGAVSHALLKAAGREMQTECDTKYPNGIKHEDIAWTKGYRLQCQLVIHVSLIKYDRSKDKEMFQHVADLMLKCLDLTSKSGLKTIAFPAFGTGVLQYPAELVAGEMFCSLERFKKDNPVTSVREAKFVIYPKNKGILQVYRRFERSFSVPKADGVDVHVEITGKDAGVAKAELLKVFYKLLPEVKEELSVTVKTADVILFRQLHNDEVDMWGNCRVEFEKHGKPQLIGHHDEIHRRRKTVEKWLKDIHDMFQLCIQDKLTAEVKAKLEKIEGTHVTNDHYTGLFTIFTETSERFSEIKAILKKYNIGHLPSTENRNDEVRKVSTSSKQTIAEKQYYVGKHIIYVYQADITKLTVDAIVNAANEYLHHGGGVAKAIVDEGGKSIQKASKQLLDQTQDRKVAVGEVLRTGPGKLPCKYVYHAVGPSWSDYQTKQQDEVEQCMKDLEQTLWNCYQTADRDGIVSMAIPSISSGIFGVPKKLCAVQYAESLLRLETARLHNLREIHFVDCVPTIVKLIQDVFDEMIATKRAAPYNAVDFVTSKSGKEAAGGARGLDNNDEGTNVDALPTKQQTKESSEKEQCVICLDIMSDDVEKLPCGHTFCGGCIMEYFAKAKPVCPTCGTVCGIVYGDQPDGTMEINKMMGPLAGFEKCDTIAITYNFSPGRQGSNHPHPERRYKGINRIAYLPDSKEGRQVCGMLMAAFERRLIFTIGTSRTTGHDGVITWNDIHHKTDTRVGTEFGYPDPTYLKRVMDELAAKGVTEYDIKGKIANALKVSAKKFKTIKFSC